MIACQLPETLNGNSGRNNQKQSHYCASNAMAYGGGPTAAWPVAWRLRGARRKCWWSCVEMRPPGPRPVPDAESVVRTAENGVERNAVNGMWQ